MQKRQSPRVQQRRECEICLNGRIRTDNPCNDINASSSYPDSEIEAVDTNESTAHNREDLEDDDVYDDVINVTNLSKANNLVEDRERFNANETIVDNESEYGDYDDIIISTMANRPLGSLITYNANPAYTFRQEYLTASVQPLPELTTNNSLSDFDDYENVNDSEMDLSEELIDNGAYIKTGLDYLQLAPIVTAASSKSHATVAPGYPQINTGTNSSMTVSSSNVSQLPKIRLTNEYQLMTVSGKNVLSQRGVVVHEYDAIEFQGNVPLVLSHEGQGTPLGNGTTSTLGVGTKREWEDNVETKFPNLLSVYTNPCDHVYDSADSTKKSGQTTSNAKEILGIIEDFDASATDTIDTDHSADSDDPDYTFDRLSPCVYMDPEQLNSKRAESNCNSETTPRFVGPADVNYSKISPVTHWQGKWSNEDLMKANAVYAKVSTMSKKPKPGTLDKKLGTLV